MVCGQSVLQDDFYFFIDTNRLDVNSTWAADWMEVDSNVEDEVFMPSIVDDSGVDLSFSSNDLSFSSEDTERAQRKHLLSFASGSRLVEIFKGDLVSNLYESLVSARFKVGYFNRKKEMVLPVIHEDVVLLRCASCSRTTHGKRTHCPASSFQFLKFDGEMIHVYTQCSKGISNNAKTNSVFNEKKMDEHARIMAEAKEMEDATAAENHRMTSSVYRQNKQRDDASKNGLKCFYCPETDDLILVGQYHFCLAHKEYVKEKNAKRNGSEAKRISNRKWLENQAVEIAAFEFPSESWSALLLAKKRQFVKWVDSLSTFDGEFKSLKQILSPVSLAHISVLDSACGTAPWPQIKFPGNSRSGRDLKIISFCSIDHHWTEMLRVDTDAVFELSDDGYWQADGQKFNVSGVKWKIYRWKSSLGVESWKRPECSLPGNGWVLPEREAMDLLVHLNSGKDVIEFGQIGGCDRMRVNSLLESYQLPPLQFFNLGARITYTQSGSATSVFQKTGIVKTPTADLNNLLERMFDVNAIPSIIRPSLNDIPPITDTPCLDVQRLWNLINVYHQVYHFQ